MEGVLGMGPGPAGGESSMDGKSRDVKEVVGKERGQMGWCGGLGKERLSPEQGQFPLRPEPAQADFSGLGWVG